MSVIWRDSSRVDFHSILAVGSPGGGCTLPCCAGDPRVKELKRASKLLTSQTDGHHRLTDCSEPCVTGRNPCSEPLLTGHPGGRPFTYSAEPLFKEEDRCPACGALILSDAHRLFIFYHSPADIEHATVMGGTPAEWRPSAEEAPIPGDYGPARVAYWHNEAPTVQVHEGDDDGMWTPCSSYTVTREGMPYSMWMCRRDHVSDPCDEEYLLEISS